MNTYIHTFYINNISKEHQSPAIVDRLLAMQPSQMRVDADHEVCLEYFAASA